MTILFGLFCAKVALIIIYSATIHFQNHFKQVNTLFQNNPFNQLDGSLKNSTNPGQNRGVMAI